jgi:branched-chain amino acid transport system ATP-binding protein
MPLPVSRQSVTDRQPMLEVHDLRAGYGGKPVLQGVNLRINRGEVRALIGRNGAGKSTLLKAVFGLLPREGGRIMFEGRAVDNPQPRQWLQAGVSYLPQGGQVFGALTVREHLELAGMVLPTRSAVQENLDRVFRMFSTLQPLLARKAGTLSGGEKATLALATALVVRPSLILLDEPCHGLSSALASRAIESIAELNRTQKTSILIVEQRVREAMRIADSVAVLRNGAVVFDGSPNELADRDKFRSVYM